MHRCPHNLARREQLKPFLPYTFLLPFQKSRSSHSIAMLDNDCSHIGSHFSHTSVGPTTERLNWDSHVFSHPLRKDSNHFENRQNVTPGKSYSILQSPSFQHWFKNWQEKRKHKLTASTFGGAIGFWPRRRVKLWLEKLGAIEPFAGNLATCWNNIKEEEALERYKLITGNTVLFPEFQVYHDRNPEDDWLAASPDGVVDKFVHELPSRGVLEIKCPFFHGDMRQASPWKRIPVYYIPQAQGLMEILDRDWMDLYVWTPNGSSLFRLYRDADYWDVLRIALSDFWWKHVQPAREICSRYVITDPLDQLSYLRPEPKHEHFRYIIYESKRIADGSELLMREIHGKLQN